MGLLFPAACYGGSGLGLGASDGGTTISTGGCADLACLNTMVSLMADCMPSGTCSGEAHMLTKHRSIVAPR